jgi:hypothetical protein
VKKGTHVNLVVFIKLYINMRYFGETRVPKKVRQQYKVLNKKEALK